jgi:hypothetical protein
MRGRRSTKRLVVNLTLDPERLTPRALRRHARQAWCDAVARAALSDRIAIAIADELIRAWSHTDAHL